MRRARSERKRRVRVNSDLNLLPLMNIIIVLIPMLLLSAVFIEIRSIEMSPPPVAAAATESIPETLDLAIRITGPAYVVMARDLPPVVIRRPAGPARGAAPGEEASKELIRALAIIASAHPENHEVRIIAEAATRYQEIIALMDVARAAGLPQAALEGAAQEG